MKYLGILVSSRDGSTILHTATKEPLEGHFNIPTKRSLLVSYNAETNDLEPLHLDKIGWLSVFEENLSYGAISPILVRALIKTVPKLFDVKILDAAIKEKCEQLQQADRNKLLNDILQISRYASQKRRRDIIGIVRQFNPNYVIPTEKRIVAEAVIYGQNILKTASFAQTALHRNSYIDGYNIFDKVGALNTIIGSTSKEHLPSTDNRLINLLKWINGHNDEFDYDILKSFFHCFHPYSELLILRKIVYEIGVKKSQLGINDLIDLVDSNMHIKSIQNKYFNQYCTTLYSEILIHSLSAYINTGHFLSQGRIIDIINGIENKYSKIEFGTHLIFDCCDGGLTKNTKYKEDNPQQSYLFDGANFIREAPYSDKYKYFYERLKYPCNGRRSSKKDEINGQTFLWCNSYRCFRSAIHKKDDYKKYKLSDFCFALGFSVLEETDCGLMPNSELSRFSDTVSKISRIAPHLYCESCRQLLFPDKRSHKEFVNAYNLFSCRNHNCYKHGEVIYINHCYTENCRGVIDSRLQKKCPNGMHICSECFGCCSNSFYLRQKSLRQLSGLTISNTLERQITNSTGHNDKNIFYCHKCGSQLIENNCPACGVHFERKTYHKYEKVINHV